jgi:hypothetical protein
LGSLKTGDLVIVTEILHFNTQEKYSIKAKSLVNSVHKITQIDWTGCPYPYKIEVGNSTFWVEGIRYSSLILELM